MSVLGTRLPFGGHLARRIIFPSDGQFSYVAGLSLRQRSMPICISCSTPVKNLYTTYSKADDRSLGKGVRLTQCPRCKRFADKYVEHDFVVLFIDLVLIKPQVRGSTLVIASES
jgi:Arv1-like family